MLMLISKIQDWKRRWQTNKKFDKLRQLNREKVQLISKRQRERERVQRRWGCKDEDEDESNQKTWREERKMVMQKITCQKDQLRKKRRGESKVRKWRFRTMERQRSEREREGEMCFGDWQKTGELEREKSGLCPQSTAVSCVLPLLTDLVQCPLSYLSPNRSNSANKWASEWTLTGWQVLAHLKKERKKEKASVGSPVSIFLFFSCFSRSFTY